MREKREYIEIQKNNDMSTQIAVKTIIIYNHLGHDDLPSDTIYI